MIENPDSAHRPVPEALLQQAHSETRGKLKIFFGAAPGVGKTYAMLQAAHERKKEGVDVVVGIIETHKREETEALVHDLEVIPRKDIPYKNHVLQEMDIDAVLARKPQLVLVDELAHTNAPGSRHPKRYQDVEEILAKGIDVYTSMNVQHLESLNDVVAQITRVRVKETVPDSILQRAEIALVDLGPEELIARLNEGKVYVPEQAQKAIQHFFAPGNLTALRELALRTTAQRVDEQMLSYMQAHAIKGPWPAGDRVMVCVCDSKISPRLLRSAKRSAERLNAPWTAVYVETEAHARLSDTGREQVNDALELAERLGGEVVRLNGVDISDEIIKYALQNNVTRIVLGLSRVPAWRERLFGNVVSKVIRKVDGIDIMIVSGEPHMHDRSITAKGKKPSLVQKNYWPYVASTLLVVLVTIVNNFLTDNFGYKNILMLYLVPVLISAVSYGLWPSLIAAFLSVAFYKMFFAEEIMEMNLPTPGDFVSMLLFLFVAIMASDLASRISMQAQIATRRERMTNALYDFSRKLAGIGSINDLLQTVAYNIANLTKARVCLLMPLNGRLQGKISSPQDFHLSDGELAAAQWSFDNGKPAGIDTDTLPSMDKLFMPLNTAAGTVGVIALYPEEDSQVLERDGRRQLNSLIDQAAIAIERMEYSINAAKAQLRKLSDQMQGIGTETPPV